ncbi:MAG: vitamin B12 dependent methionine synthase, activation domain protein [Clostridia bacterium]|nr:vitamin B12 dependent methionine synthase, activation domain protein [Clostridia bacterium]
MEGRLTEISLKEALRYLGVRDAPDPQLAAAMEKCSALLRSRARPRITWRQFSLGEDLRLEGTSFFLPGQDIRRHLSCCLRVILLAATLGMETELLLRQTQSRSMADAVLLDALASAAVENVTDNLCRDLAAEFAPLHLTPRYSPGYGDFPLEAQREVCELLNVHRLLGVSLTAGGLMIPQKTVTALAGLTGDPPEKSPRPRCEACPLAGGCSYRKEDRTCESC